MTLMCRFDTEKKCKHPQTWRYDGQTEHLPAYSLCSCCLTLELIDKNQSSAPTAKKMEKQ